ncbi:MAG: hypothetical protein LBG43_08905 [Treponema sp.]|nr:hypothetical protein [Treponema sp.]
MTSAEALAFKEKCGDNRLMERQSEHFLTKLRKNFREPMIKFCAPLLLSI